MPNEWTGYHDHIFEQDRTSSGERRTFVVAVLTTATMAIEIAAGMVYGSMALLADGLHMASHAVALGIAAFAYGYARRHAADPSYSFGTGKVNALAGYSGAVLLGVFAVGMAAESIERFIDPIEIAVNQALLVAFAGLAVNGASVFILGARGGHAGPRGSRTAGRHHHGRDHGHDQDHRHGHDHNFRSAYFHVLADTLTSVLAIGALVSAKYLGLIWLDPTMGVVGSLLVARWSLGLMRDSVRVLLDRQVPGPILDRLRLALEDEPDTRIADLHVWSVGPDRRAAIISIDTANQRPLDYYRAKVPKDLSLVHVTIEVSTNGKTEVRQG